MINFCSLTLEDQKFIT